MTLADRIVVLRAGRVEQIGTPLSLYDDPDNLFVAGFIGSPAMNLFKGTIEAAGRPGFVISDGAFVSLQSSSSLSGFAGRPLVFGIRPEHLHLTSDTDRGFDATAKIVEPTGSETQVMATASGTDIIALFRDRQTVKQGDRLRLAPSQYHLFDAASGERLASAGT
jgi:multiple sugar transport system ATP-binding protein